MIDSQNNDTKSQILKVYQTPSIEKIVLDNEISLVLASVVDPPAGPNETGKNSVPDYFNHDPYGMA